MLSRAGPFEAILWLPPASLRELSYAGRLGIRAGCGAGQLSQPARINRLPPDGTLLPTHLQLERLNVAMSLPPRLVVSSQPDPC